MVPDHIRGAWIIAASLLATAVVVFAVWSYLRTQGEECQMWQAEIREMEELTDVSSERIAEAMDPTRPEGCPNP